MFADRQGSVIWVTEPATGTALAAYEYDGYGQITQTQGTLSQPYGYTGREYDAESGLYHYRARAYDPGSGVFVQSDPIGFGGGQLSLYAYVAGDPFQFDDPTGLMASREFRGLMKNSANDIAITNGVMHAPILLAANIAQVMMGLALPANANEIVR